MTTSHWLRLFWGLTGPINISKNGDNSDFYQTYQKKLFIWKKINGPEKYLIPFFDVLCTTKEGKVIRDKKKDIDNNLYL